MPGPLYVLLFNADKLYTLIYTPSGRHVFVADYLADTVTQVDAINDTVVRTIKVGVRPEGFQFLP